VLRCEHEGEAAFGPGGEPRFSFFRDMGRVVVEDQLNRGAGRISGLDLLEETDKLPRSVTLLDAGMHFACQQIDPGQQAQCAMTFVFMVACEGRMNSRLRRQVGGGVADRLDARLLVIGDDCDITCRGIRGAQNRDLAIDAENLLPPFSSRMLRHAVPDSSAPCVA